MASENTRGRTWHSTGEVSVVGEMLPGTASFRVQNSQEQVAMLVEVTLYLQQISLPNWTQRSNFATRHLDSNTSWQLLGAAAKLPRINGQGRGTKQRQKNPLRLYRRGSITLDWFSLQCGLHMLFIEHHCTQKP